MTVKPPILALLALALLTACGGDAPADDSRSASGEVLEGTISDDMLPVDRVRSEPPLEDPEAFEKARSEAEGAETAGAPAGEESETADPQTGEAESAGRAAEPPAETAD